ncbi:hypothetical protein E4U53_006658 [Claviceps sorghi]|nr:hypothetical protein E4U53_006658 [Claviceps sorghi]
MPLTPHATIHIGSQTAFVLNTPQLPGQARRPRQKILHSYAMRAEPSSMPAHHARKPLHGHGFRPAKEIPSVSEVGVASTTSVLVNPPCLGSSGSNLHVREPAWPC